MFSKTQPWTVSSRAAQNGTIQFGSFPAPAWRFWCCVLRWLSVSFISPIRTWPQQGVGTGGTVVAQTWAWLRMALKHWRLLVTKPTFFPLTVNIFSPRPRFAKLPNPRAIEPRRFICRRLGIPPHQPETNRFVVRYLLNPAYLPHGKLVALPYFTREKERL